MTEKLETNILWEAWKSGMMDPKLMMDPTANFESRRANGIWEYRLGFPRQPTIDHVHVYSVDLQSFTLDADADQKWNIIIETADGVPNGRIVIKAL